MVAQNILIMLQGSFVSRLLLYSYNGNYVCYLDHGLCKGLRLTASCVYCCCVTFSQAEISDNLGLYIACVVASANVTHIQNSIYITQNTSHHWYMSRFILTLHTNYHSMTSDTLFLSLSVRMTALRLPQL